MKLKMHVWLLAIALALLTIPLVAQPATAQAVDAPWPMWRQNPAHTGEGVGTAPTYIVLNWKFPTDGPIYSAPSIVGGKVYFGSDDKNWYCIDAYTGKSVWKYKTTNAIRSSPAIVGGKLYTGRDDGNVYCLNATTGALIWKATGIGAAATLVDAWSSPCVDSGRVYIGASNSQVYCLDATTGATIWTYTTGGAVNSAPAVVAGKIYVGSGDNYFYCLNATGGLVWRWNTLRPGESASRGLAGGTGGVSASATVADGKVFFFAHNGGRYWALDANTGNPVWLFWPRKQRYNYQNPKPTDIKVGGVNPGDQPGHDPIGMRTSAPTCGAPAYHDGKLYLLEDWAMQCLNAKTGERQWAPYPGMLDPKYTDYLGNATLYGATLTGISTPGDPFYRSMNYELMIGFISQSSFLYADGKIYIGSRANSVYCNDAITGKRYSWYQTNDLIWSSPSLGYGNIYIGSLDWNLYCFKEGGISAYRKPGAYRTATSISATLSSTNLVVDTPLKITGSVTPAPPADPYKGAPSVIAFFTRPDGTRWEETWHLKSNQYGWYMGDPTYEITFKPDMVGTWTVKVQLHATAFDPYQTAETTTRTFTVVAGSSASPASAASISTSAIGYSTIIATIAIASVWYIKKKQT